MYCSKFHLLDIFDEDFRVSMFSIIYAKMNASRIKKFLQYFGKIVDI